MTYAEGFLLAWAMIVTAMYVVTKHTATDFKRHTLYKLKMVADGKAKIIATDTHISIEVLKEKV
jgi:hypothetical protein